jgi:phage gp36-like protein
MMPKLSYSGKNDICDHITNKMIFQSFIASIITLASICPDNLTETEGIRVCYTNSRKYSILQDHQYKLREKNIFRLSTSMENPKLYHMKNQDKPTYVLQYSLPTTNIETYLKDNYTSPFILYTILNQCCHNIALYHGLLNCYHSNTTISNFDIYENHLCRLSDINTDDKILTLETKVADYDMFFESYLDMISEKNNHFTEATLMYRKSFMKKIAPYHVSCA